MEKEVKEVVSKALKVNVEDIVVKERFLGGMSNFTYHVILEDNDYVVRIIGPGAHIFVDRLHEKDHLKLVESLGITNHTIFLDLNTGDKISSFIPGVVLSKVIEAHDYKLVADVLKSLHQKKLQGHDYALIDRLNRYEKAVEGELSSNYFELKKSWIDMYESRYKFFPKVLCHGDAQRANIVVYNDKAYLLDWEFTGNNDIYFDLASFGNISFGDAEHLLDVYLGYKASKEELNRLRFYRMYQVLQWHTVATYKHHIGLSDKLHVPFDVYAKKYLDFASELFSLISR